MMGKADYDVFPRCAWYNIRHLGISHETRLKSKLENVQALCKRNVIVGLSELHCSEGRCQGSFVDHISNVRPYYMQGGGDHVILVDVAFQQAHDVEHVQLVSGSSHCNSWSQHSNRYVFVASRFHPSDAKMRAQQIRDLKARLHSLWGNDLDSVTFVMGGDRNFVTSADQKQSSITEHWHPGGPVMSAWCDLLAQARCQEICPDEFTWKRVNPNSYVLECLDVCAHDISLADALDHQSTCTVSRYISHHLASDHMPIELEFVRRRKPKIKGQIKGPKYIPSWLYGSKIFRDDFQQSVQDWYASRGRGMQGLGEFAELVQLVARDCMENKILIAETPDHKFDVVAAAIRCAIPCNGGHSGMHAISYRKAVKYCKIVPSLETAIEWELDLLDRTVLLDVAAARQQLRTLHHEIVSNRMSAQDHAELGDDPSGPTLQTGSCRPYTLQRIKEHLPKVMHSIVKLWDERAQDFTYEESRIAELLTADAMERQGSPRGLEGRGEALLSHASLDLRSVRTHIHDDEILNAILGGNSSASPGPNCVQGHPYHEHASRLIPVFRESFDQIICGAELAQPLTEGLLRPVGKIANPCTFKHIRDLELPNFDRKVLERLFCLVLDEAASQSLSRSQVACVKGRDVASHILQFGDVFEQSIASDEFLAVLSLDCSKGFNRMSHSWIERVLRKAGCPEALLSAVMRMIAPCTAILMYNMRRMSRMEFRCGLRQGGPLSALLYVLAVDPLLCAFKAAPDVVLVLGFVDDWLAATKSPRAIPLLQVLCDEFECASGQIFNTEKTVVLTSRTPTSVEATMITSHWRDCRIVARHKIVGVLYGALVRPEERYEEALHKMETRLEQLRQVNMSTNMRIVSANVFLISHFAFLNRFFMMPESVVHNVQNSVRQFVTRISIGSVRVWTHCLPLMKAKVALIDVRLQNVALLISTANRFADNVDLCGIARARWQHRCSSCMAAAHLFFFDAVGAPPPRASSGTGSTYKALLLSEMDVARSYMQDRLRSRNLNANEFFGNLDRIPASATDHHRTNALLWLLNGLATSHRVSVFRSDVSETSCKFCGGSSDTLMHIAECPLVQRCVSTFVRQHLEQFPQDNGSVSVWPPCAHFLQGQQSSKQITLVLRVNVAVWHVRCLLANGHSFLNDSDLLAYMVRACSDPIFHRKTSKQRRPIAPPVLPANAVLYRSDGAARGQGQSGGVQSGAGAVFFGPGAEVEAWAARSLDDVTNNVAEYAGVLMVLERIERTRPMHSVLQMDSMLVTKQLQGRWRVIASDIVPHYRQASAAITRIRESGLQIDLVHIYREHNKDADAKANLGADGLNVRHCW